LHSKTVLIRLNVEKKVFNASTKRLLHCPNINTDFSLLPNRVKFKKQQLRNLGLTQRNKIKPANQRNIPETSILKADINKFFVHVTVHRNKKSLFNKTNKPTNFSKFIFVKKLYMFRAVPLPIIRSSPMCIRHWYMSCKFDDIYQCRMKSGELLMMGSGTARNM